MTATATATALEITGIPFVSSYVFNFEQAFDFYANILGLEKKFDMGDEACFFAITDEIGLYLEGGHQLSEKSQLVSRSTFTLQVPSASAFYDRLQQAGTTMIDDAPRKVGEDRFWFQFRDPSGNILEAFGNA